MFKFSLKRSKDHAFLSWEEFKLSVKSFYDLENIVVNDFMPWIIILWFSITLFFRISFSLMNRYYFLFLLVFDTLICYFCGAQTRVSKPEFEWPALRTRNGFVRYICSVLLLQSYTRTDLSFVQQSDGSIWSSWPHNATYGKRRLALCRLHLSKTPENITGWFHFAWGEEEKIKTHIELQESTGNRDRESQFHYKVEVIKVKSD